MADVLSVSDTDDQVCVVSTNHDVATDGASGAYVFQVDMTNAAAADDFYVSLLGPLFEGGANVTLAIQFHDDAIAAGEASVVTVECWAPYGVTARIRQEAGSAKTVRWTLSKVC